MPWAVAVIMRVRRHKQSLPAPSGYPGMPWVMVGRKSFS